MEIKNIDIFILCGGKGQRLKSVVADKPKPLAAINGSPFLNYLLNNLIQNNAKRIILGTGYMSEKIETYYKKKKTSLEIEVSKENTPLGTGGAIKNAETLIHSDPFMVLNGDSYCEVDYQKFLDFHLQNNSIVSLVLTKISKSIQDYGTVDIDSSEKIIDFKEKDSSIKEGLINAGIYLFNKQVLNEIPGNKKYSLEYDLFPKIQDCYGYISKGLFIDIGTPERLAYAEKILPEVHL